ncbi:MAG: TAXI family TRAP transporter solute-binding subunit [Streptosporangiales bacterium]|nr:TAXI family TRAP transporter solute-binding subunit [Streptosporangiales bacterium]
MKRVLSLALAGMLALSACGGGGGAGGTRLSIATGGTTGVYYVYGGGYAKLITDNIDNTAATASVTSGSVENLKLVASGDADIAFTLGDTASDAIQGKESFQGKQPLQALAWVYDNYTHLVAAEGSGITKMSDLKGKRVGIGAPNSGTQVIANRMLTAAGLNPKTDITPQQLGINESVQAAKDGTVDAFFWSGGVPTAGITDLTSTKKGTRLVDTTPVLEKLRAQYGDIYREATVDGSAYGLPEDVQTVIVPNFVVVNSSMEPELAKQLTALFFDHKADLVRVHPEAKNLDVKKAQEIAPMQLHPGAKQYYDEKG